jgi:hypothetical protein
MMDDKNTQYKEFEENCPSLDWGGKDTQKG